MPEYSDLIQSDFDITPYTTFGIKAKAKYFAEYTSVKDLIRIFRTDIFQNNEVLHIGGGSNLLFTNNFDGLVLHSGIKGREIYKKNDDTIYIVAGAGENWADLVEWCVNNGLGGMECMAGIPGEVGASPVQNVGAYGREAKDVIFSVECFDRSTGKTVRFYNKECGFSYRDSYFKNKWKGRYFILRVSFKVKPSEIAEHLEYAPLNTLHERLGHTPTIRDVLENVLKTRNSKLPDPKHIGSAGSFFKNPIVHKKFYTGEVLLRCPDVPAHEVDEHLVKIPAGWLIDHAGLKGERIGGAEVYPQNALVIANTGNATAKDVCDLAEKIEKEVNIKYGLRLHPEVNYIDSTIRVTVLGSGTSKGVPEIGCDCKVCTSEDPHDKRTRCSILLETMGTKIMIDASPDFREQALKHHIRSLDAVLITHIHYDHVGGLDDLRPFCLEGDVPLYTRKDVEEDLRRRLDYCFRSEKYPGVPTFDVHNIHNEPFYIKGVKITPVEVLHGKMPIVGFRIGKFAYITDCKTISDYEKEKLEGLDTLIINGLRHREHFAHLSIEEALDLISELQPKHAYITHLCHEAGTNSELEYILPHTIHPAYDGLTLVIP